MKTKIALMTLKVSATCTVLALLSASAFAGSRIWDDSFSTCTTENCSSLRIPGTVTNPGGNNDPFELQVFAAANECIRIDVISTVQGTDLETVVRAPNGTIYRNDDGSGGGLFNNPVVKINGAPSSGWYSVSINHWSGLATYTDFVMMYGRYNVGNGNCSNPTLPSSSPVARDAGKADGQGVAPVPGEGTFHQH